jgi:NTP pyrophosphatase (non-canonical NTP hydrolase)
MNLNDLGDRIAFANNNKGFAFTEKEIDQKLLLAVSEICEAQEVLRDGYGIKDVFYQDKRDKPGELTKWMFSTLNGFPLDVKPEGFPIEIADAIIRLLHIARNFDIDIDEAVNLKLEYNATRPMKHGRKF